MFLPHLFFDEMTVLAIPWPNPYNLRNEQRVEFSEISQIDNFDKPG